MSRTPGNSDDDPDISIAIESSGPTMPLADDAADAPLDVDFPEMLAEASEPSPAVDSALFARDAQAAGDAGEGRRADALVCARALLAERQGDDREAEALWRSAFDRDPTLLVAFWGVRRALFRERGWEELLGVLGRRIAAVFAAERQETRADLWLEHGRVLEDRLGRDQDGAHSYRAGLIEVPDHPGLLISLLLMGWRRGDPAMTAEALAGLLRRPLPPALRASLAVSLARLDRVDQSSVASVSEGGGATEAVPASVEPVAAARALDTLRTALGQVGPGESRPLLDELALLKRATSDPGIRAEILGELVSHFEASGDADAGADPDGEVAVALLRERARLLRDDLDDQVGAERTLYDALARSPRHPIVIADLADLAEATPGGRDGGGDEALARLRSLCDRVMPGERAFETDAERELALRTLTALARAGRTSEGLTMLDRHPELGRDRADVFALEIMLRAAAGDAAGLAGAFEHCGEHLARGERGGPPGDGSDDAAAQLLVVAGTIRECVGSPGSPDGDVAAEPNRLYRRAVEIAPGYRPARDAMERRLWNAGRNRDLADLWESELGHLRAGADASDTTRARRARLLEELVALYRDLLDDPAMASRFQDELLAMGGTDARAWVRRFDLQLATLGRAEPSTDATIRILRELAERAGTSQLKVALWVEAARAAAAGGDAVVAEELFTKARASDRSGVASAGLERLARGGEGSNKADIVRAEMLALDAETGGRTATNAARLRALRFRIAWHAQNAKQPREALEALDPLRADSDDLAWSWSWEIARHSGDPALEVAVLKVRAGGSGAALLRVSADLGGAGKAGDLAGAEGAHRDALAEDPSTDAALGLLRVGSVLGNTAVILEATSHLLASADQATAPLLSQELAMLALLNGVTPAAGVVRPLPTQAQGDIEDRVGVVLRWAAGVRSGDVLGAAAGLLAIARTVPNTNTADAAADRNGLLARAAARARFGGTALAGAVHDQVSRPVGRRRPDRHRSVGPARRWAHGARRGPGCPRRAKRWTIGGGARCGARARCRGAGRCRRRARWIRARAFPGSRGNRGARRHQALGARHRRSVGLRARWHAPGGGVARAGPRGGRVRDGRAGFRGSRHDPRRGGRVLAGAGPRSWIGLAVRTAAGFARRSRRRRGP